VPVHKPLETEGIQRSLGARIRELRREQGWSQEKFAEVCGLHRTYMGHVERGEKNVSLSTVLRVANALGVGLSELFRQARGSARRGGRETQRPFPRKFGSAVGVGFASLDVGRLLKELQIQRKALREAIRDLTGLLAHSK
jgi:transcriptional regulator with XRE-family HTH domain